jgi:hypothetical protein
LKLARLPFEPVAFTVTLWQRSLGKLTRKEPLLLAETVRLSRPTSSTRTRSPGTKPVPFTRNGTLLTGTTRA